MGIICLTKDNTLVEKLITLYGRRNVKLVTDVQLLRKDDLDSAEALIVDLKYNELSESNRLLVPIIALAEIPSFKEALVLLQRGVRGYGNRHMRQENLDQAVESAKGGQIWFPPSIITQLIDMVGPVNSTSLNNTLLTSLSKREQEVAHFVAEGLSNQEIADKMFVTLRTIKAHLTSIYNKTGLRNRLELGISINNPKDNVIG